MWPFTVEYYIKKAKKKGFTIFQIKEALKSQILWDKVLNGKSFRDSFSTKVCCYMVWYHTTYYLLVRPLSLTLGERERRLEVVIIERRVSRSQGRTMPTSQGGKGKGLTVCM